MLVLFASGALLFGAPALLLLLGKLIQRMTIPRARPARTDASRYGGQEWFYRPLPPLLPRKRSR